MQVIFAGGQRRDQRMAWLAASWNAYAVHKPEKMPEDPGVPERPASTEADVVYARAWMKAMAGAHHGD
ncbi:hypothetical protein KUV64_14085 [Mameliella alba]|jgi:hypothetical protein|uniref:hypothetical protein n=1 Tax=Mameliella TaxID=1434019 RepID=UPI000B536DE9|nr:MULTISPECIES: hypothetical protein [Mameliella]MBV6637781.1 hypothetical protein [Mameliella sp.]MBY6120263.1 hypothetical protein [Mameliella alba]MDD9733101.1 hypothetical protein [Mameliella sp. AT18]OWV64243.1 hypothetical protein CDZ97_10155 [Mameliella alba]